MSNSLRARGPQHTSRLPCAPLSPGVCLDSCPLKSVMPTSHLILCCPLLLPSVFPSIKIFSNESVFHTRWPEYWSFSFSISPSSEYSGLISFRIDWFDLLAVHRILKFSPALQLESTNSLALSLLYGPTLTSIHDCWKNCNFNCIDLC